MTDISLTVSKLGVYNEVAKTTAYTGAKMVGDEGSYERIFTTDADRIMLERFWVEACNGATDELKQFIVSVNDQSMSSTVTETDTYSVQLKVSSSYDTLLTQSVQNSLFSYFVSYIVARWYKFTNKSESEGYGVDSVNAMDDVMKKIYFRKKPTRVAPTTSNKPNEQLKPGVETDDMGNQTIHP